MRISERLLTLYTPWLAGKLRQTQVPGLKVLRIICEHWYTVSDLEIPALSRLVAWMNNFPYNSRTPDLLPLPPTSTVEDHILLLSACDMLCIEEGVKIASERLSEGISSCPLSPDDVKLLWYMFGNTPENVETIALNLAMHKTDKDEYLLWFLQEELPPEHTNDLLHRAQYWKAEIARDAGEAT
ncbi:uncharacterized protein EI97DRAFT_456221 [Westerdykella ornata]|uniref:Uncharacterized protein n=1 Tax=Westerdykella ornata TaxID=318751 RepID=A0A6A6JSD2_WESOR|nr:uncharacterized protein EI97DRAFT_456221 [Westerdykella ornata]KAF2278778.1 hypothetical protein EI97DRAFT_456221 [Westerdykella ornata]